MTDRDPTFEPKPASIDASKPLDPTVLAHRTAHRNHVALLRVQLDVPVFVVVMNVDGDIWSRCSKVRNDAHALFDAACVDFTPADECGPLCDCSACENRRAAAASHEVAL